MKMTFEEFVNAVKRPNNATYDQVSVYTKDGEDRYCNSDITYHLPFAGDEPFIYYEWCTGGATGGNCWGDEAHAFSSEEGEPDDNAFTRIVETFGESMSYMKFRRISRELLHSFNYESWEYYGNYYRYQGKAFSLKALYKELFGDAA